MEATQVSVNGLIYKLMYSGGQKSRERMIPRRKRAKFLSMAFFKQWLLLLYRGLWGCGVGARRGGIIRIYEV